MCLDGPGRHAQFAPGPLGGLITGEELQNLALARGGLGEATNLDHRRWSRPAPRVQVAKDFADSRDQQIGIDLRHAFNNHHGVFATEGDIDVGVILSAVDDRPAVRNTARWTIRANCAETASASMSENGNCHDNAMVET